MGVLWLSLAGGDGHLEHSGELILKHHAVRARSSDDGVERVGPRWPLHRPGAASEQAARADSDRPEQDRWWAETSSLFTGEASFTDSSDVTVDVTGDPDQAGFVQVMQVGGGGPRRRA